MCPESKGWPSYARTANTGAIISTSTASAGFMDAITTTGPGYGTSVGALSASAYNAATGFQASFTIPQFTHAHTARPGCIQFTDRQELEMHGTQRHDVALRRIAPQVDAHHAFGRTETGCIERGARAGQRAQTRDEHGVMV